MEQVQRKALRSAFHAVNDFGKLPLREQQTASPAAACRAAERRSERRKGNRSGRIALSVALLVWLTILLANTPRLLAQVITGQVTGIVVDTSGAVIPGATITLTSSTTGVSQKVYSSAAGDYVFEAVNPGIYTVIVRARGFEQLVVTDVEVHTQVTDNVKAELHVGAVTQKVEVTAKTPLLQTQSFSIDTTITGQQVNNMPLAGRDFTQLGMLAPGTITGGGSSTSSYTSLGDDFLQNDFRLNGIDDNDEMYGAGQVQGVSGNIGTSVIPPPDAIEEVGFQSGDYSAEFGHSTGAVINAQIKSGTNSLHGALWEYVRNTDLNANSFGDKNQTPIVPRQPYHENQFGFTVGGPVIIPKLYNGHDKTFFFVSWQDSRISTPNGMYSAVPTPTMVSSNFTNFQDYLNPSYISGTKTDALGRTFPTGTIFDPETARYVSATGNDPVTGLPNTWGFGTYVSDPFYTGGSIGQTKDFTGLTRYLNILPAGRLDPNAIKLLGVYPAQNTHPAGYGTTNYYRTASSNNDLSQVDLRIDEHLGEKDILFGTYDESDNERFEPSPMPGIADGGGYGTGNLSGPRYAISLGYTHVFTPTLTNEFHAGWLHDIERLTGINGNTMGIPEEFGIGGIPQVPGNGGLPYIYDGFSSLGQAGYVPTLQTVTSLELMDNLTKVFNKQTLKVGYEINHIKAPIIQPPQGNGALYYYGTFSDIPNYTTYTTGYADMLLTPGAAEYPQYGGVDNLGGVDYDWITNYAQTRYQRIYMGAYAQDDWRVTQHLTLNLGLRWDLTTPYTDVNGRNANLVENGGGAGATATYLIGHGGCSTTLSPGFTQLLTQDNIAVKCASGNDVSDYQHLNFAPRVGFAWNPIPDTVVRGGYGITYGALDNNGYGPIGTNYPFLNQYQNYPYGYQYPATVPSGATAVMENAFTAPDLLNPTDTPAYALEDSSLAGRAFNLKTNYIQTFNLTVQRQLATHDAVSVGYIGTLGRHLDSASSNNATSAIMPPGTNTYDPTVQGHVPFLDFSSGYEQTDNATSAYNSMQAIYQHQFSHSFDLSANWTWSKCMSDQQSDQGQRSGSGGYRAPWLPGFGIKGDWGLCGFDAARVTHVSGTWHVPVGRGKEFLGHANRLTDSIIGGWVTNLIYMDQSGQPVTIGCPYATTANFGCDADRVPGTSIYPHNRSAKDWLNINAFAAPPRATTIGQTDFAVLGGKPSQARAPAFQNIDMSIFKQFEVHDTTKFEFRAEAFNVGNWTEYAGPSQLNISNPTGFSALLGTRNDNRILQLALKLYY